MLVCWLTQTSFKTWNKRIFLRMGDHFAYMGILLIHRGFTYKLHFEVITDRMKVFNKQMSAVRLSLAWLFGNVITHSGSWTSKKHLKIGESSVGKAFIVCALLRNSLTFMYGNIISKFFQLDNPTLENYFMAN